MDSSMATKVLCKSDKHYDDEIFCVKNCLSCHKTNHFKEWAENNNRVPLTKARKRYKTRKPTLNETSCYAYQTNCLSEWAEY